MEVVLKVVLLLTFIILPLFPSRKSKRIKDNYKEEPQGKSNYGVSEGGFITLIDDEEGKRVKDDKQM